MIALIDSDILCYRVGFASNDEAESTALETLDGFIADLMLAPALLEIEDFEFYLTGKTNFRYDVAVNRPYKGNRKGKDKPVHLVALRQHLIDVWNAKVSIGNEADDEMSIRQYALGDDSIIVSLDKDLDMVPGWHYNFVKQTKYYTTVSEGLRKFYTQILTGDTVDNIQGATKIGPKKAEKLLADVETELDMWEVCVQTHDSPERALEDARLLWMQSKADELWEPPHA